MYAFVQIVGAVMTVIGGQGAIGTLIDHNKQALLWWVPGGWIIKLVIYLALVVVGVLVAGWAHTRLEARDGSD